MLFDLLSQADAVGQVLHLETYRHNVWAAGAAILLFLLASLGIWRLWRFTISPIFFPLDVREYPYWIPRMLEASL